MLSAATVVTVIRIMKLRRIDGLFILNIVIFIVIGNFINFYTDFVTM